MNCSWATQTAGSSLLRERLRGQEDEARKMRRAWRERETALRKADGSLRQKDVDLERLRHDYDRLKQEARDGGGAGERSELEASGAPLNLRSGYERSAVTLRRPAIERGLSVSAGTPRSPR